eukprot:6187782-Pleurochrysis_carterae.AAC.1
MLHPLKRKFFIDATWGRTLRHLQGSIPAQRRQAKAFQLEQGWRRKAPCSMATDSAKKEHMRDVAIREGWTRFIVAHATPSENGATTWRLTLRQFQEFIEARGGQQRPSTHSFL